MRHDGLDEAAAAERFWLIDRSGLLHDGRDDLAPYQAPFAQPAEDWAHIAEENLATLVEAIRPTVLIGVSGQPGLFTEDAIRAMADHVDRPVVMPLSNPTSRAEADPGDVLRWTDGRALVATGSPFADVTHHGVVHQIAQSNNVYIFPGLALGTIATKATLVSDAMIVAAAQALATESPCDPGVAGAALLPPLEDVREVSRRLSTAAARAARGEGLCEDPSNEELEACIDEQGWEPVYPAFRPLPS